MKNLILIYLLMLSLLLLPSGMSADPPRILLINSDASVEKYRVAQTEFNNSIAYPVKAVNLAEKRWKLSDIEDLLYDEVADVVYCIGTRAYLVANKFAGEKEIVFTSIINWTRLPVTQKTYGVSNELDARMQMMLFKYIFPDIKNIGVLYTSKYSGDTFEAIREKAKAFELEVIGREVSENSMAISSLKEFLDDIDALWLISDPVVLSDKKVLTDLFATCDGRKIPIFSYHDAFSKMGAALILSVDEPTVGRQAAGLAQNIITGTRIEKKIQFPAGSHIILNLKKIKEYGLNYTEDSLSAVNQIIE